MLAECLALLALALPCVRAEEQRFPIEDTQVVVTVDSPWPKALNKGWLPVFVRIENGDGRAHRVRIQGSCWNAPREIEAVVEVAAGGTEAVELLVPAFAGVSNAVMLQVDFDGHRQYLGSDWGAEESVGPQTNAVLVLAADPPPAGTSERWTAEVSDSVAQGAATVGRFSGYVSSVAVGPSSSTPNNVRVESARFRQMPARSEAYSSLDVVVLDTTGGLPEARALGPLLAWTKLGGALVLVGARPEEVARGVPDLAGWMESRFQRNETVAREGGGVLLHPGWRCGLGAVFCAPGAPLAGEGHRELVRMLVASSRGVVDDPAGSRMQDAPPVIPDLFALPLKAFALFLILFAVVIGPVNFVLVRRGKRPALLLLTIPAIALAAALLLLAFGMLSQGLGVEIASRTLSVLDQREHRVHSAEVRMIFAGLSPGAGLAPRPGSSCYAVATCGPDSMFLPAAESGRTFRVHHTDGLLLAGQFMPTRTAFLQQVLTEHAERARLGVVRRGTALAVENGLGATIRSLVLRAPDGGYHGLRAPLAPGASAELEPFDFATAWGAELELRLGLLLPALDDLPPAGYLATLERNPFGDDCGVTGEEVLGTHHLFGVLALDAEEWR